MTDSRRPPAELTVASGLSAKNPRGTMYEIIWQFMYMYKTL